MPIFSSRPELALCLVAFLGAACGDDPTHDPVPAVASDAATVSGDGAGNTTPSKPDAGSGTPPDGSTHNIDAQLPLAPEAGAQLQDAASTAGDSGNNTGPDDAGRMPVDGAMPLPDAQTTDAGSTVVDTGAVVPPDAGAPLCIERGESCDQGSCCDDSLCVLDDSSGKAQCVTPCEFPAPCDDCGNYCGAEAGAVSLHCFEPILLAKDGAYLGRASSSTFAPEGVCNPNSLYGNDFGTYSIHNKNGTYGNSFSLESPYAPNNFDGPAVACPDEQQLIAYVNKAGSGFDDVDPDELCDWLSRRGY
jgi:hypothetical protein